MLTYISRRIAAFKKNERGGIAIIFALTVVITMLIAGLAVDTGRVYQTQSRLLAAADAAALATAKALRERASNRDKADTIARTAFNANNTGSHSLGTVTSFSTTVDSQVKSITVNLTAEVPMTFAQLAGISKMTVPIASTAIYASKDLEISVQLDVTGSMCIPCSKIDALRAAVSDLLDIVIPDGGTNSTVRVGLAPFSAGVNAGTYSRSVAPSFFTSFLGDSCVYERVNLADQATDAAPTGTKTLKAKDQLDILVQIFAQKDCPTTASIVPMTSDKALLRRNMTGWTPVGGTAGHLGTAWAWYLLSPNWSSIWPSASKPVDYGDKKTSKVAILMTDGQYNMVGGAGGHDTDTAQVTQSSKLATDTCTAMKAQGITIYTVGFMMTASSQTVLKSCASSDNKFYDASDESKLRAAFTSIANELNNLRLSK